MSTPEILRILDNARIRLPGALDAAINLELFSVLDEFLSMSSIWKEDVEVHVQAGVSEYDVVPTKGTIVRLMSVQDADHWPVNATMEIPGILVLEVLPTVDTVHYAKIALTVTDPVTRAGLPELPEWILQKYWRDVLEGVLGKMMAQVAKPYSSERGAQYHLRNFKQSIGKAKVEAQHKNVYGGQSWVYPQTFNRR